MNKKQVELLAPAGNSCAFYGAVNAGADAIYMGGNRFGARAYADNFSTEELLKCIRYAHLLNRKVYLTVNTLIKDKEFKELKDYLLPLYEAQVDGIIVQDLGALQFIKETFPEMELHASTQMTLCSQYGAKFLKDIGATRIVPARELSLQELISIKNNVDIEIETFIHGAMCYCYSGQCLFSSILGGRSGNRGRCAQPCRLPYFVKAEGKISKEAYFLSLKDMCTIENIPELINAGIDSFKIEGRMKKPEYAAGVTSLYRKYIDMFYESAVQHGTEEAIERYHVSKADTKHLQSLYIRSEIQNGYYYKNNGKDMITIDSPAYNGNDEALLRDIQAKYLDKETKLPVKMLAQFTENSPAKLTVIHNNVSVTVNGNMVETASKQPVSEENVERQLKKLGETSFYCVSFACEVSSQAFYPLKQMNELRRNAVEALEEKILTANGYSTYQKPFINNISEVENTFSNKENKGFSISLESACQLHTIYNWMSSHKDNEKLKVLYLSADLLLENEIIIPIVKEMSAKCSIYVSFPHVFRQRDIEYGFDICKLLRDNDFIEGVLVRTIDQLGYMIQQKENCSIHMDAGLYVWNQYAVSFFNSRTLSMTLPYELNASEQFELLSKYNHFEKIVYSRIPMMITANCIMKTSEACKKDDTKLVYLKDRYGKEFPVSRNCKHCYNTIYNSITYRLKDLAKWENRVRFRIDFTIESEEQVLDVLNAYFLNYDYDIAEYTTGHERRGVE